MTKNAMHSRPLPEKARLTTLHCSFCGRDGEHVRCLGMLFSGTGITDVGPRGEPQRDDDFLLLLNAYHDPVPFTMPTRPGDRWTRMVDTARESALSLLLAETTYPLQGRSLALLRRSLAAS